MPVHGGALELEKVEIYITYKSVKGTNQIIKGLFFIHRDFIFMYKIILGIQLIAQRDVMPGVIDRNVDLKSFNPCSTFNWPWQIWFVCLYHSERTQRRTKKLDTKCTTCAANG